MTGVVDDSAMRAVLRVWVDRLGGAHRALPSAGTMLIENDASPVVLALRLADVVIVSGDREVLSALEAPTPGRLPDMGEICRVTRPWSPEPLGTARIALLGRDGVIGEPARTAVEVDRARVASLVSRLSPDEANECGLLDMERWWAILDGVGDPLAAAGFEIWNGILAQMGVAVRPDARGRGLAQGVGRAACLAATRDGLIPQWRSEVSHQVSRRTGEAIGFAEVGEQLAVVLSDLEGGR